MAKQARKEPEDDAILESYEHGEWKSVAGMREEITRYQTHAVAMLNIAPKDLTRETGEREQHGL
jgi:hypothetical protein